MNTTICVVSVFLTDFDVTSCQKGNHNNVRKQFIEDNRKALGSYYKFWPLFNPEIWKKWDKYDNQMLVVLL